MKKLLLASVALCGMTVGAFAADVPTFEKAPVVAPPPVFYDWTGLYAGVHAGYMWGNADWLFTDAGTTTSHDVDGFLAGGQIGYNFQVDNFVFGIEGDVSWSDADGSSLCPNPDFTCATELNWMGTVRARAGVALDRVLLYGTGGVAFGDFDFAATDPVEAFTDSQTYTGWTIGAGAEVALVDNLSVKAEYRYVDFGDEDLVLVAPGDTAPVNAEIDAHTLYVGLNYRFAGGLFQ